MRDHRDPSDQASKSDRLRASRYIRLPAGRKHQTAEPRRFGQRRHVRRRRKSDSPKRVVANRATELMTASRFKEFRSPSPTTLGQLADEQAALRRVAMLVARDVTPAEIISAVCDEVAGLFGSEHTAIGRFDGTDAVVVGTCTGIRGPWVGMRVPLEERPLLAAIYRSGTPARTSGFGSGVIGQYLAEGGYNATAAAPIHVHGSLWGVIIVATHEEPPPATESHLADFTELVAMAIANADSRAELASSEARARHLAAEQAALRRVATEVATEVPLAKLFLTVSQEARALLGDVDCVLVRRDDEHIATVVASSGATIAAAFPSATQISLDGDGVLASVVKDGVPRRVESYSDLTGEVRGGAHQLGIQSALACPVMIRGAVWGAIVVATAGDVPFPPDTELRLAQFADLVAVAIGNAEASSEVKRLAEEQASLRRVATLVARGVPPAEIFSAVSDEVEQLFDAEHASIARFEPDGTAVVVAQRMIGGPKVGDRIELTDDLASTIVHRTGRPARIIRETSPASGPISQVLTDAGVVATVSAPIIVDCNLWGAIAASTTREPPHDMEKRLEQFTELVATAIANAESHAELAASRARVVVAADEARRRIERDLHDGAQQTLVTLALALRRLERRIPSTWRDEISRVAEGLTAAVDELREMSHGIHPSVLSEGGLVPALKALARRAAVDVRLDLGAIPRLPEHVEVAAYYVTSEALTNASKHASATTVTVVVRSELETLRLAIGDDGIGGADPKRGSGLVGVRDRLESLGGTMMLDSPSGGGTRIDVTIPVAQHESISAV